MGMESPGMTELTSRPDSIKDGLLDEASPDDVTLELAWSTVYDDLKQIAHARLRSDGRLTLIDTTALVNESFLRLLAQKQFKVETRRKFFAYASRVMRSVIVDMVREQLALRRGGDVERVALTTTLSDQLVVDEPLRVDDALVWLGKLEPRLAEVVQMRYFGGLTDAEIAETLKISERTVGRDWEKARLLLRDLFAK